jgi:hypothetical protein
MNPRRVPPHPNEARHDLFQRPPFRVARADIENLPAPEADDRQLFSGRRDGAF